MNALNSDLRQWMKRIANGQWLIVLAALAAIFLGGLLGKILLFGALAARRAPEVVPFDSSAIQSALAVVGIGVAVLFGYLGYTLLRVRRSVRQLLDSSQADESWRLNIQRSGQITRAALALWSAMLLARVATWSLTSPAALSSIGKNTTEALIVTLLFSLVALLELGRYVRTSASYYELLGSRPLLQQLIQDQRRLVWIVGISICIFLLFVSPYFIVGVPGPEGVIEPVYVYVFLVFVLTLWRQIRRWEGRLEREEAWQ